MEYTAKVAKAIEKKKYKSLLKLASIEVDEINLPVDDKNNNLLMWAIENKQFAIMKACFKNRKIDMNFENSIRVTPIKSLIVQTVGAKGTDDYDKYKAILKAQWTRRDFNVNHCNKFGSALIYQVCVSKDPEILSMILDKDGLDVNLVNDEGNTALSIAADIRDHEAFDLILNHKNIDVNKTNNKGFAPLNYADLTDFKKLLAREDIDVNAGKDVILCNLKDIEEGNEEAIAKAKILLNRPDYDVNRIDENGRSILTELYKLEDKTLFNRLLKRNDVNYDLAGENDETLLMLAVKEGDVSLVKSLLAKNVDVNAFAVNNELGKYKVEMKNALMYAIDSVKEGKEGSKEIFDMLLAHKGLDINASGATNNALLYAATVADEYCFEKLINSPNIDLNAPNPHDTFARLVETKNFDMLGKLVVNGKFDPTAIDENGDNALKYIYYGSDNNEDYADAIKTLFLSLDHENIEDFLNHSNFRGEPTILSFVDDARNADVLKVLLDEVVNHFGYVDIDFDGPDREGAIEDMVMNVLKLKDAKAIMQVIDDYKNRVDVKTEEVDEKIEEAPETKEAEEVVEEVEVKETPTKQRPKCFKKVNEESLLITKNALVYEELQTFAEPENENE